MKNLIPPVNEYTFHIYFIDSRDENFIMDASFSISAPHYEAAVAHALAHGHQIVRSAEKESGRILFMRLNKA